MYCLTNKKNSNKNISRLNRHSHSVGFLNDDSLATSWISSISSNMIQIIIDLVNGAYLLEQINISFTSFPPTNLVIQRFYENKWYFIHRFSIDCEINDSTCSQLPK